MSLHFLYPFVPIFPVTPNTHATIDFCLGPTVYTWICDGQQSSSNLSQVRLVSHLGALSLKGEGFWGGSEEDETRLMPQEAI